MLEPEQATTMLEIDATSSLDNLQQAHPIPNDSIRFDERSREVENTAPNKGFPRKVLAYARIQRLRPRPRLWLRLKLLSLGYPFRELDDLRLWFSLCGSNGGDLGHNVHGRATDGGDGGDRGKRKLARGARVIAAAATATARAGRTP